MDNAASIIQHLREALRLLEERPHRQVEEDAPTRRRVTGTGEAWELFKQMSHLEQEEMWVIVLNNTMELLELVKLYRGNVRSAIVRPAEVFREAIRLGATSVAIAHNHPGGDPRPSTEDLEITKAVAAVGKIMDIPLLDHLVIGRRSYTSIIGQRLVDMGSLKQLPQTTSTCEKSWTERIEL